MPNPPMKMAELTRRSGVSTATIKFYLREGLLHAGLRTAPNQAAYDDSHLRRLKLIRALREVAGLGIDTIRRLLKAIEDPDESLIRLMGELSNALLEPDGPEPRTLLQQGAEYEVNRLFEMLGWEIDPTSAVRRRLADVALVFREAAGAPEASMEYLLPYAHAVAEIAKAEVLVTVHSARQGVESSLEQVVTGTIFGEQVLDALRRAAHEHWAHQVELGRLDLDELPPWVERSEPTESERGR